MVDYSHFEKLEKVLTIEEKGREKAVEEKRKGVRAAQTKEESSSSEDDANLHPLFWTKLPQGSKEADDLRESLSNMIYEDRTPDELAADFKEKGNEAFKWGEKFYDNALKYYTEGLEWSSKGTKSEDNQRVYAIILTNRAAIQLHKRNYRKVIRDCKAAIKYGPKPLSNCKAYFRGAKASFALERFADALDFANRGMQVEPGSKALKKLKAQIEAEHAKQQKVLREKEKKIIQRRQYDEKLRKILLKQNIRIGSLLMDIASYTGTTIAAGDFPRPQIKENGSLVWKVIFLYPEFNTSDFIQQWEESITFGEQLERMFPRLGKNDSDMKADWDENGYYCVENLGVFFEERYVKPLNMKKMWESQLAKAKSLEEEEEDFTRKLRVRVGHEKALLDALSDTTRVSGPAELPGPGGTGPNSGE